MLIRMRGHHLVCLHFYLGEKQDARFHENMRQVVFRAEQGELIEVVGGADDVCQSCSSLVFGRCGQSEGAEDEIVELDHAAREGLQAAVDTQLLWQDIRQIIDGLGAEWLMNFCEGCGWKDDCRVG